MAQVKLSIVIPVFNNCNFTKSCLSDLARLPTDTHEIIVVDNGSTDKTQEILQEFGSVKYYPLTTNTGFAFASNFGYEKSTGEFVMFLNNDIRVQKNHEIWTSKIIDEAKGGYLVGPTGGLLNSDLGFIKETNEYIESNLFYMSGWNLTASKDIWNKLKLPEYAGPFSEEFFVYFEDTDLSFRAKKLGIPMKIVPVPVVHFGKMTSRKLNTAALYLSAKEKFYNKWINQK